MITAVIVCLNENSWIIRGVISSTKLSKYFTFNGQIASSIFFSYFLFELASIPFNNILEFLYNFDDNVKAINVYIRQITSAKELHKNSGQPKYFLNSIITTENKICPKIV